MGSSHHEIFDFNFRVPFLEGTASVVVFVTGMLFGAITWIVMCLTGWNHCGKAIVCALIGMALVLLLNVCLVIFVGYDGYWWGYRLSMVAGSLFTFIALLVSKFGIVSVPQEGNYRALAICVNILMDILMSILLMTIPVAILSAVIWLVMEVLGS